MIIHANFVDANSWYYNINKRCNYAASYDSVRYDRLTVFREVRACILKSRDEGIYFVYVHILLLCNGDNGCRNRVLSPASLLRWSRPYSTHGEFTTKVSGQFKRNFGDAGRLEFIAENCDHARLTFDRNVNASEIKLATVSSIRQWFAKYYYTT